MTKKCFLNVFHLFVLSLCLHFFTQVFALSAASQHDRFLDQNLQNYMQAIQSLEKDNKLDGHLMIAKGQHLLLSAMSQEISRQSQEEPQFMIGSLSKQFFAVALLKVLYDQHPHERESKRIEIVQDDLNRPLCNFLPPQASIWKGHMPEWAHVVTLHQLLTHTSGIPNYTEVESFTDFVMAQKRFLELPHAKGDIIQLISRLPLLFRPGTEYCYSNTNYVLIAEVIEKLSGLPASVYLQKNFFSPLHMTSTFSPSSGQWQALKKQSRFSRLTPQWQYDPKREIKDVYQPDYNIDISNAVGSGSIISTASDLLKWNLALHRDHSIIPSSLYQLMITPDKDQYGYGLGIESSQYGVMLGHQGLIDTYQSLLLYFPKHDLSIIFLSHIKADDSRLDEERDAIIAFLGKKFSEDERELLAEEELMRKYPDERGFKHFMSLTDSYFETEEMQ